MQINYYNAYDVLKDYIKERGFEIRNFNLIKQRPDHVIIWVEKPENEITHFVCQKNSPTQFFIWGYNSNGQQAYHTSFSFEKPSGI